MSAYLDEAQVEIATVGYFLELGYEYVFGPDIATELVLEQAEVFCGERPKQ